MITGLEEASLDHKVYKNADPEWDHGAETITMRQIRSCIGDRLFALYASFLGVQKRLRSNGYDPPSIKGDMECHCFRSHLCMLTDRCSLGVRLMSLLDRAND